MYIHKNKAREYKENCCCNGPLLLVGYGIFFQRQFIPYLGGIERWWNLRDIEP